jgi:hypothetical protein
MRLPLVVSHAASGRTVTMERAGDAVLRHWLLLAVLAPAVILRVMAWFAIHPAWWILGDGIAYLQDAIHLHPDNWRPSGYSLLLLRPLLPMHSLSLVTGVQHVMGIGVGVLVYATSLRLGLPRWVAVLAAIPVLFDGYVIATEQMLASESLFVTLIVVALVLLLWPAGRPAHLLVAAAGLLLALAALTRTVGLPLIAVAALFLLLPRPAWSRLLVICVAFALPIWVYALWFSQTYGQVNLTLSSGIFMYGEATQFVDCSKVRFSDDQLRRLCPTEPVGARNEVWYVFDANSPLRKTSLSGAAYNELAGRFAVEAIRAQPAAYAAVAWDGIVKSFAWDQGTQFNDMLFKDNFSLPDEARAAGIAYQHKDPTPISRPSLVRVLAVYQSNAHVRGTVCVLTLIAAAAALLFGRDSEERRLRGALLLTAGVATVLLMVPAMTTIVAPRYRIPAIPELCLAGAIGGTMLVNRWKAGRAVGEVRRATID